MSFASDNWAGASTPVINAVSAAMQAGPATAYGADEWTGRAEQSISAFFERDCAVFFMTSGTAANALALAHVTPPWGTIYAHEMAHVATSECGAPEFYSGAKLHGVAGAGAKIAPQALDAAISRARRGDAHSTQPATLSLTNLTECGTCYPPAEITALAALAHAHHLTVHLDGARFANALVSTNASPAAMTWQAGVDVMSLGATKNGAMAAEAVVFFDPARASDFLYRRMRGGHLLSKMRFVAAQVEAWLKDDHWRDLAAHANAMAKRLADGLVTSGLMLAWPADGNEVFPIMPMALADHLRQSGHVFYPWPGASSLAAGASLKPHEEISRLICSFQTKVTDVDDFLAALATARRQA